MKKKIERCSLYGVLLAFMMMLSISKVSAANVPVATFISNNQALIYTNVSNTITTVNATKVGITYSNTDGHTINIYTVTMPSAPAKPTDGRDWEFMGWTVYQGTGTLLYENARYKAGQTYRITSNTTYVAVWKRTASIFFVDPKTGVCQTVQHDEYMSLVEDTHSLSSGVFDLPKTLKSEFYTKRSGYTFAGYKIFTTLAATNGSSIYKTYSLDLETLETMNYEWISDDFAEVKRVETLWTQN